MQLVSWREQPNFGDALGPWLAERLFPQPAFNDAPGTLYFVGTVLADGDTRPAPRVVFGAGTGYSAPPRIDDRWRVYFVRGPRTSHLLGGQPWITDPGILVHHFWGNTPTPYQNPCAFMPRWDSMSDELIDGCCKAGIAVIDPRWPVERVIESILSTKLLLTEALHGAVVADVLRVPWISIYASRGHEFKWQDWCGSLEQVWNPIDAAEFSLAWARDYAVPQLSAQSVSDARFRAMTGQVNQLVKDIVDGRLA